jgi:hypothetical protein
VIDERAVARGVPEEGEDVIGRAPDDIVVVLAHDLSMSKPRAYAINGSRTGA